MSEGCKTLELDCKKLDGTGCTRLGQARLDCTRLYEAIGCEELHNLRLQRVSLGWAVNG